MGVKNLWDVLESCKKILPLQHLQNKRLCIDLSCWMVQLQNVNKSHCAIQDKVYLRSLFHRLRALIALNCSLIFVTDGSIPAIKLATYRQRLKSGIEVTQDETNSTKACSLRRNMGSAFSRMIKEAKALGLALGIPCLDGTYKAEELTLLMAMHGFILDKPWCKEYKNLLDHQQYKNRIEEAEAQCALLNSESLCDGCFTSDSDVFLFGARTVYRDICLGKGGHVVCYEMADIEKKLGFGRNSLITLALLLGSDYSEGIHGLGPESACQIVKSVGDNNVLQRIASEGLSFAKKAKNSKKRTQPNSLHPEFNVNGREENIDEPNQFLQVIDAYLKPKCHSADSDVVYRVLVQLPFQRVTLQQICAQFFAWPPEKTDEYILPKIAEGDLRRFANLRRTSSELGVRPPPDKIPVKCPVSGIVKRRKAQGRECFEVLWEGLDGLETSIVPVDLIDSACPEKIAEFEERRAMGKKQNHQNRNPRTKKSRNRSAAAEVDLRLQTLLLDIESGSSTTSSDSFPSKEMISEEYSTTATAGHPHMVESQQSVTDSNAALPPSDTDPSLAKYEIIDLLSPSPPVRARKVSRFQRVGKQCIELIDSSESETEASPEHVRKARELRLFLASIKDDIS